MILLTTGMTSTDKYRKSVLCTVTVTKRTSAKKEVRKRDSKVAKSLLNKSPSVGFSVSSVLFNQCNSHVICN
jgi:hypothetical protein